MIERPLHEKYTAVFSPTKAVEGLTREQWLKKIPTVDAMIVLGSGLTESADGKVSRINMHGKMRALAAYELYQAGKAQHIIVTGGTPHKGQYDRSMARAEKEYLMKELDVNPGAVSEEQGNSQNTIQNFENIMGILKTRGVRSVIIVSNGYHIPRAEAIFKKIAERNDLTPFT